MMTEIITVQRQSVCQLEKFLRNKLIEETVRRLTALGKYDVTQKTSILRNPIMK